MRWTRSNLSLIHISTAIDMYLKQISLVGGIPFSIVLPKAANSVNTDMMSVTQIHQKLEKGYRCV